MICAMQNIDNVWEKILGCNTSFMHSKQNLQVCFYTQSLKNWKLNVDNW